MAHSLARKKIASLTNLNDGPTYVRVRRICTETGLILVIESWAAKKITSGTNLNDGPT